MDSHQFSAEVQGRHDAAAKFAAAELGEDVRERDERGEFWREGYQRCAKFGVTGLPIPQTYGGQGKDLVTSAAVMEGL